MSESKRVSPEDFDKTVLALLKAKRTLNANQLHTITHRKHETCAAALRRLEERGIVYSTSIGKSVSYVLIGNGDQNGDAPKGMPDRFIGGGKVEEKDEGYARISWNLHRASCINEIIEERGFVLHPRLPVGKVPIDKFIRSHHNGEYHVGIKHIGSIRTTEYIPETNISIRWEKKPLNTNLAYHGTIFNPDVEKEPYKIRTVTDKDGECKVLSIWVHPRYVYNVGCIETSKMEFIQQIKDVLSVLERFGWEFTSKDPKLTGNLHYAFNNPVLPELFPPNYEEKSTDELHADHSHGLPEVEYYGDDPEVLEIMTHLPTIVKTLTTSVNGLSLVVAKLVEMDSKLIMKSLNTEIPQKQEGKSDYGGMYQ